MLTEKVTSLVVDTVKNDNYTDVQNTEYFSLLALKPDEKNSNDEIGNILLYISNCLIDT